MSATASVATNKEIVARAYEEIWNQGDLDASWELFAPDVVINHALEPEPLHGVEAFNRFPAMLHVGFPDLHVTVERMVADGDRVATRWVIRGTHTGDFMGIPGTNSRVEIPLNEVLRVSDGRIREIWVELNAFGVAQQLGILPPRDRIPRRLLRLVAWARRRRSAVAEG